jgi:competence protein ComEC
VRPFLLDAGVSRLAAAFASHPDADHVAGLPAVHAGVPFERLFGNGRPLPAGVAAALPPAAPFLRGARFERAGVVVESLWPPEGAEPWSDNDGSLVLRVTYGATAFLLLADVELGAEAALVEGSAPGGRAPLAADVVKVAHHGSRTSSGAALVAATAPRWAVVSAGRVRRPAREVLRRWEEAGAEIAYAPARFLSDGEAVVRADPSGAVDALAILRERP